MAKFGKVRRVTTLQMEIDLTEADFLLLALDKARTQMVNDGSNTSENIRMLNELELNLHSALQGDGSNVPPVR